MHVQGDCQYLNVQCNWEGYDNWVRTSALYIPVWTLCDLLPPHHSLEPSWLCPSSSLMSVLCISQFQAPTSPSPRATPGVLHSTAAPGPGFILDDLPQGPGFCISIKLRLVQ